MILALVTGSAPFEFSNVRRAVRSPLAKSPIQPVYHDAFRPALAASSVSPASIAASSAALYACSASVQRALPSKAFARV